MGSRRITWQTLTERKNWLLVSPALERALQYVRKGWSNEYDAVNATGDLVSPLSPEARKWSLKGALIAGRRDVLSHTGLPDDDKILPVRFLTAVVEATICGDIKGWNYVQRDRRAVIKALRKTIEFANWYVRIIDW